MPDSYGHAKDFFDPSVKAGKLNQSRGLLHFPNGGNTLPKHGDLVVWDATSQIPYGHVAIVSSLSEESCEVIQQNSGPWGSRRRHLKLLQKEGKVTLPNPILGWLRLPQ